MIQRVDGEREEEEGRWSKGEMREMQTDEDDSSEPKMIPLGSRYSLRSEERTREDGRRKEKEKGKRGAHNSIPSFLSLSRSCDLLHI